MTSRNEQSTTHSRFLRAANVELDLTERDALQGYVLTATGRTVLRRMSSAVTGDSNSRAWTLTGPYGTGKSAFTIFTANLLNHGNGGATKQARELLQTSDPELATILDVKSIGRHGLIPIAITGTREPVEGALLRGVQASITTRLNGTGKALKSELSKARNQISNGKPVGVRRLTELISDSVEQLCKKSKGATGVFLVLDELGKLLEYANHHSSISDLFMLQELAEHFSRSDRRCLLLGILHQDFGAYATRLAPQERAEWNKIRGRFEDISFHEPAEEMLRLVASALEEEQFNPTRKTIALVSKISDAAWKLGLAPGSMSKSEFTSIIQKCVPLHPVVAISLGTIFQRLAQNERSAFSFLRSNEPFGFCEFAKKTGRNGEQLYGLARLYDYLIHSIRDSLYSSSHSKLWAETESILSGLADASASEVFLVKSIGLINAIGRDDRVQSSREILQLASEGCLKRQTSKATIEQLIDRRIIVDRKFNQTLALWEGSDVDIDAEIHAAREHIGDEVSVAKLAKQYFPTRPVVARRHSFETGNIRYFPIRFVSSHASNQPADLWPLTIRIALPESQAEERHIRQASKNSHCAESAGQLVCIPHKCQEFGSEILELASLQWISRNVKSLEGDRAARREISIRVEGIKGKLANLLSVFLSPDENPEMSTWIYSGQVLRFGANSGFQDQLSHICDQVFPKAPKIHNELINRSQLSSAAAKARRVLIERMFSHRSEPDLGLEKAPPEKSVYLSVLNRSGLHAKTQEGWGFKPPSQGNAMQIEHAWKAITGFFKLTETGPRPVSELFDLLAAPPYGIKEGPMPLLLCAALLVHENEIALYKDGTFIPTPSDPDFELLVKSPDRYTIQQWSVKGVRAEVFERLAKLLGREFTGKDPLKSQLLDLVRPLLRFYKGLNAFTLQTRDLSDEAVAIRKALGKGTEPDTLLFSDLPKAVGLNLSRRNQKTSARYAEDFVERLRSGLNELQTAYDRLLESVLASLRTTFSVKGTVGAVRKALAKRAAGLSDWSGDPALSQFVVRILETEYEDREWLEMVASQLVLALPCNWKDGDLKRYQNELRSIARVFYHVEAIAYSHPTRTKQNTGESLRIGITLPNAKDTERVIHLSDKQAAKVEKVELALESELKKFGRNNDVALAALARVTQRRLSN